MASKLAEKAPGWFTRILMPELVKIKAELKNLNARIDSVNASIDSFRNEMKADISRIELKLDEMEEHLSGKLDSLYQNLSAKIDRMGNG